MIIRIFQVEAQPGREDDLARFLHETALPLMRQTEGLVSVTAGLPRGENPGEFCMVMVWQDLLALKAFAGRNYADPHILPEEANLVRTRRIRHYDLVAG